MSENFILRADIIVPDDIVESDLWGSMPLSGIMNESLADVWLKRRSSTEYVRYFPFEEGLHIFQTLASEPDKYDTDVLANVLASQTDYKIYVYLERISDYAKDADSYVTSMSVPGFELSVVKTVNQKNSFTLYLDGAVVLNGVSAETAKNAAYAMRKVYDMGVSVDLPDGQKLTAKASVGDYPEIDISLDTLGETKLVSALEYQNDDPDNPILKTYFYGNGEDVSDTITVRPENII